MPLARRCCTIGEAKLGQQWQNWGNSMPMHTVSCSAPGSLACLCKSPLPCSRATPVPPAMFPVAHSPHAAWPGPAWVPREGSYSADASIATARDMRTAWIQQFQLISSLILQQFSEPVGCFRLCKRPLSCTVAPFPFSAPRRVGEQRQFGSTPAPAAAPPCPHTGSPSVPPPAPRRTARTDPVGCSPAQRGWGSRLHGALGPAVSVAAEQGTFGPEQGTPALGWVPCFPHPVKGQALEHPLPCPNPLPWEEGEQWSDSEVGDAEGTSWRAGTSPAASLHRCASPCATGQPMPAEPPWPG